jgi:hypothetical protein
VGLARSERSFIIQGPPGTGKSQTITNLIADYAGRGKRVLFVCEKRAALDVVFSRLRQSSLDSLCCLIHDSQTDKKAFIADLKACYENWIAQPDDGQALQARRAALAAELDAHQGRIDAFEAALAAAIRPSLGTSVRALLRRVAALPAPPDRDTPRARKPAATGKLGRPARAGRTPAPRHARALRPRQPGRHAFSRLAPGLVADEAAYRRVERLCQGDRNAVQAARRFAGGPAMARSAPTRPAAGAPWRSMRCACWRPGWPRTSTCSTPGSAGARGFDALRAALACAGARTGCGKRTRRQLARQARPGDADRRARTCARTRAFAAALAAAALVAPARRTAAPLRFRQACRASRLSPGAGSLAAEHAAAAALAAADADSRRRYGVSDMAPSSARWRMEASLRSGADAARAGGSPAPGGRPGRRHRAVCGAAAPLEQLAALTQDTLDLAPGRLARRDRRTAARPARGLDDLPDLLPLLRAVDAAEPAARGAAPARATRRSSSKR